MDILIKRATTISGSRLLALSMPLVDFIILGYFSASEVALHTLATQLTQIAIVIIVTSGIGINFIIGKDNIDKKALSCDSFGYLTCIGLLCLVAIDVYSIHYISGFLFKIVFILSLGIPFTAGYVANSAILESNGHEKKIFFISTSTAIFNLLIAVTLVHIFPHPAMMVAYCTTIIRMLQFVMSVYLIKINLDFYVKPTLSTSVCKNLFKLSISDVITSLAFISSIYFAVVFIETRFDVSAVSALGVSLSHMNIISVICVSFCISYIIQLSNSSDVMLRVDKKYIKLACVFYTTTFIVLLLLNPLFSFAYNMSKNIHSLDIFLLLSIAVVLIDGIAMFINGHLRVYGYKITPPLFRLAFVFVGIPLGCFLSIFMSDAKYMIVGMITGNVFSLFLSVIYYFHKRNYISHSHQR